MLMPVQLSDMIIGNITTDHSKIDWTALEQELETEDKSSPLYYGGADLSTQEVVQKAQSTK